MNAEIQSIIQAQRALFDSGVTQDVTYRKQKLKLLLKTLRLQEDRILDALKQDLKKHPFEAFGSEISTLMMETRHALKNLSEWAKPQSVSTPLIHWPAQSKIIREPLGLILVFSPWNYPFFLSLAPIIGAVAAGNCCILKPSEFSPATTELIKQILNEVFEPGHVAIIEGDGKTVGPELLSGPYFNHVFFTGSPAVGREVMKMAAEHLIPVTLELGGKSPAIVEVDANIKESARRIVWGKFWNAGQTCIAPDYVLVHQSCYEDFIRECKFYIQKFYGNNAAMSESYGRMIHLKHLRAVATFIQQGELLYGGQVNEQDLFIEPTLIKVSDLELGIMNKEIFGPVLPIVVFNDTKEALEIISRNPDPLALYVFSKSRSTQNTYLNKVRFGGAGVNMPLLHFATVDMPLEGIGTSGTGNYHGQYGFETFSHRKSILASPLFPDLRLKYPPFPALQGWLRWVLRKL